MTRRDFFKASGGVAAGALLLEAYDPYLYLSNHTDTHEYRFDGKKIGLGLWKFSEPKPVESVPQLWLIDPTIRVSITRTRACRPPLHHFHTQTYDRLVYSRLDRIDVCADRGESSSAFIDWLTSSEPGGLRVCDGEGWIFDWPNVDGLAKGYVEFSRLVCMEVGFTVSELGGKSLLTRICFVASGMKLRQNTKDGSVTTSIDSTTFPGSAGLKA